MRRRATGADGIDRCKESDGVAIQNMAWQWGWALDGATTSLQVNFSPQLAVALCSLSQADGEGLCAGGVTQYRTRAQANGPDTDHNFGIHGSSYWLAPVAFDHHMTSVSAELDVGGDQQGTMTLMVWLWK
jgi:hypothetical protein